MQFVIAESDHYYCQFPAHADADCAAPATFCDLDAGDEEIGFVCDQHLAPVMRSHEQRRLQAALGRPAVAGRANA